MNVATLLDELKKQHVKLWLEGENLRVQVPKGAVTPALRSLITQHKADLVAWLQQSEQATHAALTPLPPLSSPLSPPIHVNLADRYQPFPLTDIQHAYWIGRSGALALGDVSTHGYLEFSYTHLDVERLTITLNKLIARHEMLRAVILPSGQQQILENIEPYQIFVMDLRGRSAAEQEEQLAAIRQEMSHQVLPYDKAPFFDLRVTYVSDCQVLLHLSLDILMFDVGSLSILFDEWRRLYENPNLPLAPLEFSFRDYVLAEEVAKTTPTYQAARAYWLKRIGDFAPAPELPLAQMPSALTQQISQRRSYQLPPTTWQRLKGKAQQMGISPSVLQLTLFAATLKSWSKQPRFTLNLTLFNRPPLHQDIKRLVGDFTSLILVDVDYTTPLSLAEQSKRLQFQLWEAIEHRQCSGIEVMREISRQQNNPQAGLMPVVFTSAIGVGEAGGTGLFDLLQGELRYGISQTPQVWLDHQIFEYQGGLLLNWDSVDALFPPAMLDDMFTCYCDLIERLARDESLWNDADLSLLPPAQARQFHTVNATASPIDDELLPTGFLYQVQEQPTAPAVITPERTLSYQELYQSANQIGHCLRSQGVKPNQLVAVVMEKGWEQVVAVLGIHLAGAAYLPIDPSLPTERQHYLLQQGEVTIALTQQRYASQLTTIPSQTVQHFVVDKMHMDETLPPLTLIQKPTDIAYVIYTSGSTGVPKGVIIDHRGAVNTILDINRRFGVTNQDRVLALSALNFDLSVYDIFGLLAVGGAIVLPEPDRRNDPDHWLELMSQHGVTLWDTVPALMQMLVDTVESRQGDKERGRQGEGMRGKLARRSSLLAPLRLVMLSGDWIPVTLPDRIQACWADVTVYGLGGATEASIWSNYFLIEAVDPTWPSIPYGKPLTNQSFQVLDTNLNPRPVWVPGDLYIGGIGLALGYWKDEEKTQAKFIIHPQSGERLYKTGDLARYLPDGNLEFLGREDFQVKIRGHRIELGEIENALLQYPGVKEAVVNAAGDPKGHRQLVGYVVLDHHAQESLDAVPVELKQLPDVYEQGPHGTITDPINRLEFKLRQPAIRQQLENQPIALPTRPFDEKRRHDWLARQSYRRFLNEVIPLEAFSDFLSCLQQMPLENAPLPKYRYPSAGNLYPVQTYLYIKAGRIEGLAGGTYYYHPVYHQLVPLQVEQNPPVGDFQVGAANQGIFAQAAFTLFLVADLAAIAPLYGEIARDFALLEAGYMSQLLMMQALQHELGLCPIGGVDQSTLQSAFALGIDHQFLHALAGGRIDPCQMKTWLQPTGAESTSVEKSSSHQVTTMSWSQRLQKHLAQKLPNYMIPTVYLFLDALPLTANGKVDRKALPLPDLTIGENRNFTPPRTATEQLLVDLWSTLLGVQQVGIHDDFFTLGGDSLLVTQMRTRLRASTRLDLPLRTFFEKSTVAELSKTVETNLAIRAMQQAGTTITQSNADEEEETW